MSTLSIVVMILSLIAGFISQAVSTGALFGQIVVPKTWLPYATLIGTFLAGFIANIAKAGTLNSGNILSAVLAGFMALTGTAVGVTCHQHIASFSKKS